MPFTCRLLSLLILHLLCAHCTAQDVSVACYESVEEEERECNSTRQLDTVHSYRECCVLEGDTPNKHRYILQQGEQCSVCGPVLDEALFFPVTNAHDNSTIFIYWGLHTNSLPATLYVVSVGLESEGEEGLTTFDIRVEDSAPPSSSFKHQYTPVTPGLVYTISVRAVSDERRISSPVTSVVWRVGDDILPTFYNFTTSLISLTGTVTATWRVLTAGLRPLTHLSVHWVETAAVEDEHDLTDTTSPAYPSSNIEIREYDVTNRSQVVMQDDIISIPLRGLTENQSYYVGVTATSVLGHKTTVFQFTAEGVYVPEEAGSTAKGKTDTSLTVLLLLTLQVLLLPYT